MNKYEYREWASDGGHVNFSLMNKLGDEGWLIIKIEQDANRVYYIGTRIKEENATG